MQQALARIAILSSHIITQLQWNIETTVQICLTLANIIGPRFECLVLVWCHVQDMHAKSQIADTACILLELGWTGQARDRITHESCITICNASLTAPVFLSGDPVLRRGEGWWGLKARLVVCRRAGRDSTGYPWVILPWHATYLGLREVAKILPGNKGSKTVRSNPSTQAVVGDRVTRSPFLLYYGVYGWDCLFLSCYIFLLAKPNLWSSRLYRTLVRT